MDRFAAMESFVRTVERGSFAAAAAGRGLSATMVGNHVRFLEARLGASLLNRTTRQHSLTEFGRLYYERCRAILVEIEAAEAAAGAVQAVPRGLLRITVPVALGTTVLPRLLAGYLRRHPEVKVDLVLQDHRLDLVADELDVAIRAGTLPDSSLIARALPPMQLVVCAAPAYLAAYGAPHRPADLASHNCLDFAHAAEPLLWRFAGDGGEVAIGVGGNLRINSGQALRAAALEGIGIVMQPDILVADDLAAGRLVRLLSQNVAPTLALHLLTLPNRHPTPKLRSFIDHVVAEIGRVPSTARGDHTPKALLTNDRGGPAFRDCRAHGLSRPPLTELLALLQVYEIGAATGCPAHVVHCSLSSVNQRRDRSEVWPALFAWE